MAFGRSNNTSPPPLADDRNHLPLFTQQKEKYLRITKSRVVLDTRPPRSLNSPNVKTHLKSNLQFDLENVNGLGEKNSKRIFLLVYHVQ